MQLTIDDGTTSVDVTVDGLDGGTVAGRPGSGTGAGSSATIGDLMTAAGLPLGHEPELEIDGRPHRRDEPVGAALLGPGSTIRPRPAPARNVVRLTRIAGPGSGRSKGYPAGTWDVGEADADGRRLARARFRMTIGGDGSATLAPLDPSVRILDGVVAHCGDAVYRVDPEPIEPDRPPATTGGTRLALARGPRLERPEATITLAGPEPPTVPRPPQPLSWIVLLAPIPFGIVMALLFSPFFLAFTLMSPIMSVARWWDGRRQVGKGRARAEIEAAARLESFAGELDGLTAARAADRRASLADLGRLRLRAVTGSPRLWEVRPGHGDHLRVAAGLGPVPWRPDIEGTGHPGSSGGPGGLEAVLGDLGVLTAAPVDIDLGSTGAVGVVGHPAATRSLAAALVTQLTTRHGPADVELAAVLDPAGLSAWDWLKWLPHLLDEAGRPRVVGPGDDLALALAEPTGPPGVRSARSAGGRVDGRAAGGAGPGPAVRALVIDDEARVASGLPEVTLAVNGGAAVAVVVATTAERLPSFCRTVVEIPGGTGPIRVVDTATAERIDGVVPILADPEVTAETARALARFVDPEAARSTGFLPTTCHLSHLVGDPSTEEDLIRVWEAPPDGLEATIGVGEDGPFRIDLVRDGPHGLVAGTTGSGKSELLRTMITSLAASYDPSSVNFVLVDFKGGGAFDLCADLPHTVGVVTDLDEHLAERALRCLRAELTHRERWLRDAGVSDLRDLPPGALPRLVIVIDEFATLVAELPTFVSSLVDVAQRGRSLGIHLMLATQRPTGVVDAKIRANTNLRIALRVQDDGDSTDVIGRNDAASIHRDQAGRAFARLGADELTGFQTAIVSVPVPPTADGPIRVTPFRLASSAETATAAPTDAAADADAGCDGREPAVRAIAAAAGRAAEARGQGRPRVPWPPALPDEIDLASLDPDRAEPWSAAIGLVDLPDQQRQEPLVWSAVDDGNLLVFGVDPASTDGALVTLCTSLTAAHDPSQLHVYAADFSGGLGPLDELPHVGARVGPLDDELVGRFLTRIDEELEARRALRQERRAARLGPDDVPLFVVVIANYAGLLEHLDERGDLEGPGRLAAVIRDGGPLGMVVVASGLGERGIPMRISAQVPARFVLRLADPLGYSTFGLRPVDVPELGPGRAIDARSRTEVQFAAVGTPIEPAMRAGSDRGPAPIRVLPTTIPVDALIGRSGIEGDVWRLAVGLADRDLEPAVLELRTGVHAVVAGPPGSGRSSTLRTIGAVAGELGGVAVHTVGLEGAGSPVTEPDRLWSLGAEPCLVLVDDVEIIDPDLANALERLANEPRSRARLVVAGRPETFKGIQPLARALTVGRTGVLLQPAPDAGDVFRLRVRVGGPLPVGRGWLLSGGIGGLAQVAVTSPEGAPDEAVGHAVDDAANRDGPPVRRGG